MYISYLYAKDQNITSDYPLSNSFITYVLMFKTYTEHKHLSLRDDFDQELKGMWQDMKMLNYLVLKGDGSSLFCIKFPFA